MVASDEITELVKNYMEGGDQDGFGANEPWALLVASGGGLEDLVDKISEHVTSAVECPRDDSLMSAMLFGRLVAKADLDATELSAIQMYMQVAYEADDVTAFKSAVKMDKGSAQSSKTDPGQGSHGGSLPSKKEAAEILAEKGMPWRAVVVVTSCLYTGMVPTLKEIDSEGYGSDPAQWKSTIQRRKAKKWCLAEYLIAEDAKGYKEMVMRGAMRMSTQMEWQQYAASVYLFVNKLSDMTFEQGRGELFLAYCEEHHENYKGKGLASAESPFDHQILTETVLAKQGSGGGDQKLQAKFEAKMEAQEKQFKDMLRTEQGKLTALQRKMEVLERSETQERRGPPGADNPCLYCGATDHFVRQCPKKKADQERKKADAEKSKEE